VILCSRPAVSHAVSLQSVYGRLTRSTRRHLTVSTPFNVVFACCYARLFATAFQSGVSVPDYARGLVHDDILQRGAAFREKGAALRALINAGKAWLNAYHECVAVAAGLPGKERRAELERLTWEAVKKAHEFIQTDEAAKNAKKNAASVCRNMPALCLRSMSANCLTIQINRTYDWSASMTSRNIDPHLAQHHSRRSEHLGKLMPSDVFPREHN